MPTTASDAAHVRTTTQSQFLPETDFAAIREFRVEGVTAIRGLMRDLQRKKALIALYAADDHDSFFVTQLLGFDDHCVEFDFVTDQHRRRTITASPGAVVVAFLDQVKLQFEVDAITEVALATGPALRCPMPGRVYRIQRRDAYRVRPLGSDAAVVFVPRSGRDQARRVMDFSVTGVAIALPPGETVPEPGTRWDRCRLEFAGRAPIPCDLVVRHVSGGLQAEAGARRIGCEFSAPPPDVARAIQLTVLDTETRAARAR